MELSHAERCDIYIAMFGKNEDVGSVWVSKEVMDLVGIPTHKTAEKGEKE